MLGGHLDDGVSEAPEVPDARYSREGSLERIYTQMKFAWQIAYAQIGPSVERRLRKGLGGAQSSLINLQYLSLLSAYVEIVMKPLLIYGLNGL
jgi:hypothetical protein